MTISSREAADALSFPVSTNYNGNSTILGEHTRSDSDSDSDSDRSKSTPHTDLEIKVK